MRRCRRGRISPSTLWWPASAYKEAQVTIHPAICLTGQDRNENPKLDLTETSRQPKVANAWNSVTQLPCEPQTYVYYLRCAGGPEQYQRWLIISCLYYSLVVYRSELGEADRYAARPYQHSKDQLQTRWNGSIAHKYNPGHLVRYATEIL